MIDQLCPIPSVDKGKYCVVDVTFHPDTIKRCTTSPSFKDFLIKLAIEYASKRLEGKRLSKSMYALFNHYC